MSGRKILDETDARASLKAAARSGLTNREWAQEHGIDGRSLRAWAINLGRRGSAAERPRSRRRPAPPQRLVELVASGSTPSSSPFVVRVGGFSVDAAPDFSEPELRRLLGALAAC